ncbi:hypothetical protein [Sinomonas sp. B1-1]|uniref:hypothetical protein n=1 Tax=Sinomonas sp. B1-1 TaxID=3141454 RepID=UPI003D29F7C7
MHGVGGFTPEELLGDLKPTRVWGDRIAGFYRTADSRGRHLEAYAWGGLTSHSPVRVLWTLLTPAMLANMAGWMARRRVMSGSEEAERPPTTRAFRWCARLAALALTVSVAVMVTLPSLDTVAFQCLGQVPCREHLWATGVLDALAPRDLLGVRLAWGALPPVAVAVLFYLLARVSRNRYENVEPPADKESQPEPSTRCAAAQPGGLRSPAFWSGRLWHSHLSNLHLAAGIGVAAAMLAWCVAAVGAGQRQGAGAPDGGSAVAVLAVSALVLAVLVLTAVLVALAGDEARGPLSWVLLGASVAALGAAVAAALLLPAHPGQPGGVLPGIVAAVNTGWGLSVLLLLPLIVQQIAAWASRRRDERRRETTGDREAHTRIGVFPWAAPVVLNAVALVLANGVLVSAMLLVALGLGPVRYGVGAADGCDGSVVCVPKAVISVQTILVCALGAVLVGLLMVAGVRLWARVRKDAGTLTADLRRAYRPSHGVEPALSPPVVQDAAAAAAAKDREAWMYSALDPDPGGRGEPTSWVRRTATVRVIAERTPALAAALVIVVAVPSLVGAFAYPLWVLFMAQDPPVILPGAVMGIVGVLPVAYGFVVRYALRDERKRRLLMVPFDVGTFFPRAFHPFAPPAYAERAVPDLTRRIWWIHDNGGRVVLSAHSQGSVIAAATVARRSERKDTKDHEIGLVTFGAPLAKLYRWAFPALFSDGLLRCLAAGRGGLAPVRWKNLYYLTDYIGGDVEADWDVPANSGDETVAVGSVDVLLLDPPSDRYVYGQALPRILSHTGYWFDTNLWLHVNEMCDRISPPEPQSQSVPCFTSNGQSAAAKDAVDALSPDPSAPLRYRL